MKYQKIVLVQLILYILLALWGGGITEPIAVVIHCLNASKLFGEDDPEFTGYVEGLVDNDTEEDFGIITYYRINTIEEVGSYPDLITASVSDLNPKYIYTVKNGSFTINAKPITP